MKYTVSGIKSFRGMEGTGFNANLLEDGKKVCFVMDSAQGAEYDYEWVSKEAEERFNAYLKTLPPTKNEAQYVALLGEYSEVDSDGFVCNLVEEVEATKRLKRACKTKTLVRLMDGNDYEYKVPYTPEFAQKLKIKHGEKLVKIYNEELAVA